MVETIQWTNDGVVMIDQTRLPLTESYVTCRTYEEVATAIRDMVIRGAPAIGVAAAMGVALGVLQSSATTKESLRAEFAQICETLAKTRPTAVDLFWAIERMKRVFSDLDRGNTELVQVRERMVAEARQVHLEKKATDEAIGAFGAEFM